MAILEQPVNNSNPFADVIGDDLAPAGTYVATILDIRDEFGVQRQKYQSMEMEMVDLTTFLLGFRDAPGAAHRVSSKRMKISGNEKSTLFGFLKSLQGHAPQYGWDYCTLKGKQCLLTVEHIQRRDGSGVFAAIAALSPVPAGYGVPAAAAATVAPSALPMAVPAAQAAVQAPVQAAPAVAAPSVAPAVPVAGAVPVVSEDDPIPF